MLTQIFVNSLCWSHTLHQVQPILFLYECRTFPWINASNLSYSKLSLCQHLKHVHVYNLQKICILCLNYCSLMFLNRHTIKALSNLKAVYYKLFFFVKNFVLKIYCPFTINVSLSGFHSFHNKSFLVIRILIAEHFWFF